MHFLRNDPDFDLYRVCVRDLSTNDTALIWEPRHVLYI